MAKKQDNAPNASPAATAELPRNIYQRLVAARVALRETPLARSFQDESSGNSYSAFSIHQMAIECEKCLTEHGILFSCTIKSWSKNGNISVIDAIGEFINIDDPTDTHEVATVGEGICLSDKGFNKAVSAARKNALAMGLNLAVGVDPETASVKAALKQEQTSGGISDDLPPAGSEQVYCFTNPVDGEMASFSARAINAALVAWVSSVSEVEFIDKFLAINAAELSRFGRDQSARHAVLAKIFAGRRQALDAIAKAA